MAGLLKNLSDKSIDHEFYSPYPEGYVKGKTKYIIVLGTVMSGLGKGILSSSIGKLLQYKGLTVAPIKFDGYLNQDAGTLNPFRHGEVFVLDDGTESDMDLGTYERMLNINISKDNYMTNGKLFQQILNKERKGEYLGRDVQVIPHVTGEIKLFLRNLAMKSKADVVLFEVGGTVGDLENMFCIEAARQLIYEEGKENVCFIALTYILEPEFLGEQKSKAAQLGIKSLLSMGIQPDLIGCRAHNPVSEKIREKISVYSNVAIENVVSLHDVKSIYVIPGMLRQQKIGDNVMQLLGLSQKNTKTEEEKLWKAWEGFEKNIISPSKTVTIGITGKYTSLRDSYASVLKALEHAGAEIGAEVQIKWIETTDVEDGKLKAEDALKDVDGILVPGGWGKRGTEGKIKCINYIREHDIPYLGVCYGMQMAVIEFARNVCKIKDANSTEIDPETKDPVIDILPEQKKIENLGGTIRLGGKDVEVKKNTKACDLYSKMERIRERFRHRYEVNPKYISLLEKNGMVFSGKHPKYDIMQIMELPKLSYFVGAQYHPEFTSRPLSPNPLYLGLVKAAFKKRYGK
ncbi:MAG: CTP synthase (glutamine hydrolyzing) [Nanoarchaeota archaeon]|nr:CTP synthase (glutamine hydrolyzing) [Nanoarchaeota archaeon]